ATLLIDRRRDGGQAMRAQIEKHVGAAIRVAVDRAQRSGQLVDRRVARGGIADQRLHARAKALRPTHRGSVDARWVPACVGAVDTSLPERQFMREKRSLARRTLLRCEMTE